MPDTALLLFLFVRPDVLAFPADEVLGKVLVWFLLALSAVGPGAGVAVVDDSSGQ